MRTGNPKHRFKQHNVLLYIMHITETDGSIWHYAGVTTERRMWDRLLEHKRDTKRDRVAQAVARGAQVTIHNIDPNASTWQEQAVIAMSERAVREQLCPQCATERPEGAYPSRIKRIPQGINKPPAHIQQGKASKRAPEQGGPGGRTPPVKNGGVRPPDHSGGDCRPTPPQTGCGAPRVAPGAGRQSPPE